MIERKTDSDVFEMTEEEKEKLTDPDSDVEKVELKKGNKKATFERVDF